MSAVYTVSLEGPTRETPLTFAGVGTTNLVPTPQGVFLNILDAKGFQIAVVGLAPTDLIRYFKEAETPDLVLPSRIHPFPADLTKG